MSKKKKKGFGIMALVLGASVMLGACGDSSSAEGEDGSVTWKLNHIRPADTRTDISAHEFANNAKDRTEGRVNIEIYANSQLGDYQLVQESVSTGEIQMQLATLGTNVDPTLQVAIAPYLVTNWEEAKEFYNSEDGKMNQYLSERLEEQNIKLLGIYPQYFGSVFLAKEAAEPKDPSVSKNVKIRVPAMKSFEEFGKGIGFQVTPLPATEMFTSLQTGIVDGAVGGGTELYYNEFAELGEYILPINTHFEAHYLTVNKDAFESLSEEDQQAMLDLAKEFEEKAFAQAEEEQNKYNELIENEEGVEVIEFTDEEIKVYADHVRKEVWPKLGSEYGDIFEEIQAELGL